MLSRFAARWKKTPVVTRLPAPVWMFVAGILESKEHRGADPALPVGGGVRVVCTDDPTSFAAHLGPGEEIYLVPRIKAPFPLPYGWWPWIGGAAEIHVATSIWPRRLRAWGTWEAEKYFNERVVPLMNGRHNRPSWWWQRPSDWAARDDNCRPNTRGRHLSVE
jgi:hypothetical protein